MYAGRAEHMHKYMGNIYLCMYVSIYLSVDLSVHLSMEHVCMSMHMEACEQPISMLCFCQGG